MNRYVFSRIIRLVKKQRESLEEKNDRPFYENVLMNKTW